MEWFRSAVSVYLFDETLIFCTDQQHTGVYHRSESTIARSKHLHQRRSQSRIARLSHCRNTSDSLFIHLHFTQLVCRVQRCLKSVHIYVCRQFHSGRCTCTDAFGSHSSAIHRSSFLLSRLPIQSVRDCSPLTTWTVCGANAIHYIASDHHLLGVWRSLE